uniref:Uncharacterized protein n=1 Tax=Trichuris muris TaxID=70415 RepID=A0A5S6R4E8_TRIMR
MLKCLLNSLAPNRSNHVPCLRSSKLLSIAFSARVVVAALKAELCTTNEWIGEPVYFVVVLVLSQCAVSTSHRGT